MLLLFGCYAEVAKDEIEKIDEVDLVLGNKDKVNIREILDDIYRNNLDKGTLQCAPTDNKIKIVEEHSVLHFFN